MTKVLIDGGRTADTDDYEPAATVGGIADQVGQHVHGHDGQFSFKVGGALIHPDTRTGDVALSDEHVVELVEVTDQNWDAPETVLEVGVPHDVVEDAPTGDVLPDDDDDQG